MLGWRLTRRDALGVLGGAAAASAVGCIDPVGPGPDAGADAGRPDAAGADAGADRDAGAVDAHAADGGRDAGAPDAHDADAAGADAGEPAGWATGGTAAMVDAATYPNPFGPLGNVCALHCSAILGPCHVASPLRHDVSEGSDGLPVRLALRVVDGLCQPLPNAIVEIWHTDTRGIYSGLAGSICNDEAEDQAADYFRGYLRTDAAGRVDFDTVFPGWYSGRAIHIHFRIMVGPYDGDDGAPTVLTSQLFFADDLVSSIFAGEPVYADHGQPDKWLTTDGVTNDLADPSPYVLEVSQMTDGAMMAAKTLVVDLAGPTCAV